MEFVTIHLLTSTSIENADFFAKKIIKFCKQIVQIVQEKHDVLFTMS